jgi:hypothetical protein
MSSKNSQAINLDALQDRLDDLADRPLAHPVSSQGDGDVVALAIATAVTATGHAPPGNQGEAGELSTEGEARVPVPRLGAEAAANMTKLAKAAAQDIRQLGRLAFDAGKRVQDECEQMALDVEANGGTVALHLTGLSQLLADVGMSNRETLHRLLGGTPPSIVPSAGNGNFAEHLGGTAKTIPTVPFGKAGRRPE